MIYATAGHVDHGKTSLVKAITSVDTDRLAEEKARGLTIELGFAYVQQDDNRIGFVDVPGHARFISNMLAGVSAIDHALFVIAADDGPMPQTVEHVAILQMLGIEHGTVALTKTDRVSQDHLQKSELAIRNLLSDTPFAEAPIFPTSTETNQGIDALKHHLMRQTSKRQFNSGAHFRLAIDRKFNVKGAGVVVTGSVFSGAIETGQDVYLMPQGKRLRVRGLHRQDSESSSATTGDRCAINLSGDIDQEQIERGNWITTHPALPVSDRLDCQLSVLGFEAKALRTGTPVHIHLGAQHTTGRAFLLEQRHLEPGTTGLAQLSLNSPISACAGDRFVIRDGSATRTLGGGTILDPYSVQRGRSKPARIQYLKMVGDEALRTDFDSLLTSLPGGLNLQRYCYGLNVSLPEQTYPADGDGANYHPAVIDTLNQQILALVKEQSQNLPSLREKLGVKTKLLELTLSEMSASKQLHQDRGQYQLPNTIVSLSKPAETLWKKVEPLLTKEPLQPPIVSELAKSIGLPPAAIDKLLSECIKQNLCVRPIKNRYFLTSAMQDLRSLAQRVAEDNEGRFTVIQFRDASGMGRNLCIELLEHLDSRGFTKRIGDQRVIQDKSR